MNRLPVTTTFVIALAALAALPACVFTRTMVETVPAQPAIPGSVRSPVTTSFQGDKLQVATIQVTPDRPLMQPGEQRAFIASVQLADGSFNGNVTWSSSDDTIAVVDNQGRVSALREGKVTITAAYTADFRFKGTTDVLIVNDKSAVSPSNTPEPIIFGPKPPSPTAVPLVSHSSSMSPAGARPTPTPTPTQSPLPAAGTIIGKFSAGSNVRHIAVDSQGNAWVLNYSDNGTVTKVAPNGAVLATYFVGSWPEAIAVDDQDKVWICRGGTDSSHQTGTDSLLKLSQDGKTLGSYSPGGKARSIKIFGDFALIVNSRAVPLTQHSYQHHYNIAKIDLHGKLLSVYQDSNIKIGDLARDRQGNIWAIYGRITDINQNTGTWGIWKLSPDGVLLDQLDESSERKLHIAVGSDDNIWVSSGSSTSYLTKYSQVGEKLLNLSLPDSFPRSYPLTLAPQGSVLVGGRTIQKISSAGAVLASYEVSTSYPVVFDQQGAAWASNDHLGTVTRFAP
jgi:hypothetical protein